MLEPAFDIRLNDEGTILICTLRGHWSLETLNAYQEAMEIAIANEVANKRPASEMGILIDTRLHGVQSKEVSERIATLSAIRVSQVKKTAVVVSNTLHRLQARRLNADKRHAPFHDIDAAISWLLED